MQSIIFKACLSASCLFSYLCGYAYTVDTVVTYSPSMQKYIKAVVILPDAYGSITALPVLYLLHGYSGNYADWVKNVKGLGTAADSYGMMIVCPDGAIGSWYWDSPVDSSFKYETYVSRELVEWVDKKYKTLATSKGRAVTGLSMGGQGALYLAFRHQDVFGAAGTMSGGVDIRPFPANWDMSKRLGPYNEFPGRWDEHSIVNMLYLLRPGSLALIIDCGTEDFFFRVNENLHQLLILRNIGHDYIVRPGGHTWAYWSNAVGYQLLFMHNFFLKSVQGAMPDK